jgi:propionyl-CoA carboxylase alpha chain
VQVLADDHGSIWAVGERECSIQRRYQKIIEEAPSPLVERVPEMRARLFDAARAAARAVGYRNAGTVEFLGDENGQFYFLEMNTRLQVEHPVTECTTGLDLVALQLQLAEGRPLPGETPPPVSGHAIEARLYAEDPAADWQPQSGTVHRLEVPGRPATFRVPSGKRAASVPAVRVDSGVAAGSRVGVNYDPMLAKVIAWAPDRERAAAVLSAALAAAKIHGLMTNRNLLVRVLRHPAFLAGQTDTAFLDTHGVAALAAPLVSGESVWLSALAAALAGAAARQAAAPVPGGLPSGWRNVPSDLQRKSYNVAGSGSAAVRVDVGYRIGRAGLIVDGRDDIALVSMAPGAVRLDVGGVQWRFEVAAYRGMTCVDSGLGAVALRPVPRFAVPVSDVVAGSLLAPMPGTVSRLGAAVGERVAAGQPLLWLEAMKMEHVISAPAAGIVADLAVAAGQHVEVGSVLAIIKPEEDPA